MEQQTESLSSLTRDNCQMAMLCHLLGLTGLVIPFGNFIGPLIVWLIRRNDHPLIDDQGKESLNFQITYTLIGLILMGLMLYKLITSPEAYFQWSLLLGLLVLFTLVYVILIIVAAVKANEGSNYRYPLTIRFIQ